MTKNAAIFLHRALISVYREYLYKKKMLDSILKNQNTKQISYENYRDPALVILL